MPGLPSFSTAFMSRSMASSKDESSVAGQATTLPFAPQSSSGRAAPAGVTWTLRAER